MLSKTVTVVCVCDLVVRWNRYVFGQHWNLIEPDISGSVLNQDIFNIPRVMSPKERPTAQASHLHMEAVCRPIEKKRADIGGVTEIPSAQPTPQPVQNVVLKVGMLRLLRSQLKE